MLEEIGTVVEVYPSAILVETQSRRACSRCSSKDCTTAVVARLFGIKHARVHLENSLGAKLGDQVVIGIPDDLLVKAALWAYLLPLMFILAGPAVGSVFAASEGVQSLLALSGLAVGVCIVRWATRNLPSQRRFKPQLLRLADGKQVRVAMPKLSRSQL
jgi:sigma-E factor negative regulatory protein RseC